MKTAFVVFAFVSLFLTGNGPARDGKPADLILLGGTIHTLDPQQPRVEAVAVSGQQIVFAGSRKEAEQYRGPATKVVDATGKTVFPGFVDAHAHLASLGNSLSQVDLTGTRSAEEVRRRVIERMSSEEPGRWIVGRGWDQNDWSNKQFPTWRDLEGTESHPVSLVRVDGHAVWLNRRALEMCAVTRQTADPPGGKIMRDTSGEPTGILLDNAANIVAKARPPLPFDERVRRLRAAVEECQRNGLTGVHDAGVGKEGLEALRYLEERDELGIRVYAMIDADESAFAEALVKRGPAVDAKRCLTVRALKVYADGALGSRGAALLEPYADDPGNKGILVNSREDLVRWTTLALENGYQVCTHAIGDAGNRTALDAYEESLAKTHAADPRLRIEHAQVLALEDIGRFARLGVIASMQPTHATSDMDWAPARLGPERVEGAYAWRKMLDTGAVICCGSDFPVEAVSPLFGIYAAVTRKDRDGRPEGGWQPEECMTMTEALGGFTTAAAFASFSENIRGMIKVGMMADFTILNKDLLSIEPRETLSTRVVCTVVGGRVVFEDRNGGGKPRETRGDN